MSGKLNKRQASLIYGIKGNATILYWINQSQGLKGYEAKAKSPANFAEMKRTFRTKNWKKKTKNSENYYGWQNFVPTCGNMRLKWLKKKFNIDILKSMVPNNPLLPKAKTERKITEMCGVFGRSKQAYYKQKHHKADTTVKEETIVGLIKRNGKYGNEEAAETCINACCPN
ncbi:MAG: hypothetical protein IPH58_00235 [Sphingobacteriales bacterium]|nr:hypothetical protein [Sphingobacteriales bacterium]